MFFKEGEKSYNPLNWSVEQQETAFLANLFTGKGSDEVLARVGSGDQGAMTEAYSKWHHTNIDDATREKMSQHGLYEESFER